MKKSKTVSILLNFVYFLGVVIVLILGIIFLFGSNEPVYPDNMIPYSWKETAFIWLAIGTIPMILTCTAVCKFNSIKKSIHKKWNFALIFLPGFICSACALYIIGVLIAGMINMFVFHGALF